MKALVLQFERTLIVADEDSQVSYLEGCTAPSYDKNQVQLTCLTPSCFFFVSETDFFMQAQASLKSLPCFADSYVLTPYTLPGT